MTASEDILRALNEHGPLKFREIVDRTGIKKNTVRGRLYDMSTTDNPPRVARDAEDRYQALVAAKPAALPSPNGHSDEPPPAAGPEPSVVHHPGPQANTEPLRQPISGDQEHFHALLKDCDVKKGLDTISQTVFAGDPEDLEYVLQCLEDARAFVQPLSRRLIMRHWAVFTHRSIPEDLEERMTGGEGSSKSGKEPEHPLEDLGLGWQVSKDRDGEWVPKTNGDLSYKEALRMAATMNATRPQRDEGEEDGDSPRGRRSDFQTTLLEKLLDNTLSGNGKRESPDDDRFRKLEEELAKNREDLAREREERANERMQKMENMLAAALNRDPIEQFFAMREKLALFDGPPQPMVTDQSPTVQLIKDSSDKFDKGMNRVAGVIEQVVLRAQGDYVPEEHSSDDERERRAAELAGRMEQSDRSQDLRKDLFGR